jgi:hypothetical protein
LPLIGDFELAAIQSSNIDVLKKHFYQVNTDYLRCADYKMGDIYTPSGLICGYDCVHYEEHREAVPYCFMEIDKSLISLFVELLKKIHEEFAL